MKALFTASVLCLLFVGIDAVGAQSMSEGAVSPLSPEKEKFQDSYDLLVPWRDASCAALDNPESSPCVTGVTAKLAESSTILNLYNEKGDVWKTLDLSIRTEDLLSANKEIVPFATPDSEDGGRTRIWLRVSGESPSWYRVVANEDSGQIAYALKAGVREWAKTTFKYWFHRNSCLELSKEHPPLYDAPNGKPIDDPTFVNQTGVCVDMDKFDHPESEWVYVTRHGWIRWRDGHRFLVGSIFGSDMFRAP